MKLEKAKEILELNLKEAGPKMPPDCAAALALGIEAINIIQQARKGNYLAIQQPLPGETND